MISRRLLRIKVVKALYAHILGQGASVVASQKTLSLTIAKSYELYYLMLRLPVEVAFYAQKQIEERKAKLRPTFEEQNPNMRFVENPVILQLSESVAINSFLERNSISWTTQQELIKRLYLSVSEKEYYKTYMEKKSCNYNDHKKFVKEFYLNEIEDNDYLHEVIEEMSAYWIDDIEYAASHAMRTVSLMNSSMVSDEDYQEIELLPMYKDADDAIYARDLFVKAASTKDEVFGFIDKFTHNWDVDRIAFMDKVIMVVAITEIREFASIPLTVSLDEYIEISKFYSTTNSSNFVNGILDKIVTDLKAKGEITKSE